MGRKRRTATLDDIDALLTLQEAAAAIGMSIPTLRLAIRRGELVAFIPRGREPLKAGPGHGYRITRDALRSWYFGAS